MLIDLSDPVPVFFPTQLSRNDTSENLQRSRRQGCGCAL